MTQREKRIRNAVILLIILALFGLERLYNNSKRFQVKAKDASSYGLVEAKMLTKEKLEDFAYISEVLRDNYPYFGVNKRSNQVDWFKNRRAYRRLIKNTKTDAEYFLAMERILGDLNDSHVKILSSQDFKWQFKYYYEKLSKSDDTKSLSAYDAITDPYVTYRYMFDGNIDHVKLYEEPNLETQILEENKVAYMKIKAMAGFDLLDKDLSKIEEFVKEIKNYDKLIIDIRGNRGGEDEYWKKLIELLTPKSLEENYYSFFKGGHRYDRDPYKVEGVTTITNLDEEILNKLPAKVRDEFAFYKQYNIQIKPKENSAFNGQVYLLVDSGVTSQAVNFASFAKDTGFATLVGEDTGGGRVFEDIPITYLPNTKFAIKYSRELAINKDGTINMETKTKPHIGVEAKVTDSLEDDKAINAAIKD